MQLSTVLAVLTFTTLAIHCDKVITDQATQSHRNGHTRRNSATSHLRRNQALTTTDSGEPATAAAAYGSARTRPESNGDGADNGGVTIPKRNRGKIPAATNDGATNTGNLQTSSEQHSTTSPVSHRSRYSDYSAESHLTVINMTSAENLTDNPTDRKSVV